MAGITLGPTPTSLPQYPQYVGYICCAITATFFGSTFVPVKKAKTGDGMFMQWIFCAAIWFGGLVVYLIQNCPKFYPLAMLSGVLWATGNVCVVPIFRTIGMGLGICIWGIVNMLAGWASGRFGWFGLKPEPPGQGKDALNYTGVVLAVLGAIFFVFVKSEVSNNQQNQEYDPQDENRPLILNNSPQRDNVPLQASASQGRQIEDETEIYDKLGTTTKRVLGTLLSLGSGVLYGVFFAPCIYIQENYPEASQTGLDYVFPQTTGIFATSSIYFLIYCCAKGGKPDIFSRAILPGFISGIMWFVADASWFVANQTLSEAITYPIVTTIPAILSALWAILYFKEIQGTRNLAIVCAASCLTIAGVFCVAFSK